MKNVDKLLDAADYIETHPDEYDYGWQGCVAAHVARQAGMTLSDTYVVIDSYNYDHIDPWATNYLDLTPKDRYALFVDMIYADDRYDAVEAAAHVRRFVAERTLRGNDND